MLLPNFHLHQKHLGGLLKHRLLGFTPRIFDSVDSEWRREKLLFFFSSVERVTPASVRQQAGPSSPTSRPSVDALPELILPSLESPVAPHCSPWTEATNEEVLSQSWFTTLLLSSAFSKLLLFMCSFPEMFLSKI